MANLTVEQIFRHPNIIDSYSMLKSPGRAFIDFYNMGPGNITARSPVPYFSVDIYNATRRLSGFRAPGAGPSTVQPQKSGTFSGHIARMHEKLPILDNDIAQFRPRGSSVGTLDTMGQKHIADQTRTILQRFGNTREVCLASTFKGGFGLLTDGESMQVVPKGTSGAFDVDSQIPATNLTTVESIFGSDSWDTASTDVVAQFLALQAHSERVSGFVQEYAWVNFEGIKRLYANTDLRAKVGTAYRIFDIQTGREISTIPDGRRQSGYMVKFTAIPQITFIVYDGVHNIYPVITDSTASADSTKLIPDGKMIVTPAPSSEWLGQVTTGEVVRENVADMNPQFRYGFYNWVEPKTQPSGRELIFLDWFLYWLKIPSAVYYVDIYTP
jgi:hypothetical protein